MNGNLSLSKNFSGP